MKYTEKQRKDKAVELRRVCDAVPHLPMFKTDVETGVYAQQLVTVTLAELFRHEFPETKWVNGGIIPMATNVDEGAKEYGYQEMEHVGEADIVADNATDLPTADVAGRYNLRRIVTVADSIRYSTQDIRTARLQGMFDIAQEKAVAAREAMDRRLDELIRTGRETAGLQGITNAPGIIVQSAITGTWSTATGTQIVSDFTPAANTPTDDSSGIEMPDTALFSVANWTRISTLVHLPAVSDRTVLSFLKEAFPHITRWDWEPGLSTADAAGTGNAVMIYKNDPSRVRAVFPMMMRALPPEQSGLVFKLGFETRFGGVMVPRPRSIIRLDGT
jgi:hypothetical protein